MLAMFQKSLGKEFLIGIRSLVVFALSPITVSLADSGVTVDVILTRVAAVPIAPMPAVPLLQVATNPTIVTCRFPSLFISQTSANRVELESQVSSYVASRASARIVYAQAADGSCELLSIAKPSGAAMRPAGGISIAADGYDPQTGQLEGYQNKHASSYPRVFRDFGQGSIDEKVDPITGRLSITMKELIVPGSNGMDIRLIRKYVSPDPRAVSISMMQSMTSFPFGFGWSMLANIGGFRGKTILCDQILEYNTDSITLGKIHVHALPSWVGEDGAEPMAYENGVFVTASGVRLPCVPSGSPYRSTATYPNGTKVTLDFLIAGEGIVGVPRRIEDRWQNWIAFEYITDNDTFPEWVGVDGIPEASMVPLTRITTSDARLVTFDYASLAPGWKTGDPISRNDFYLKRVKYGAHQIEYEVVRREAFWTLTAQGTRLARYFLTSKTSDDGKRTQFAYDLNFPAYTNASAPETHFGWPQTCYTRVGMGALQSYTRAEGGTVSFTWSESGRVDRAHCYPTYTSVVIRERAMVRTRTTSDGGFWRYSYSDMSTSVPRTLPDDAPPSAGWYVDPNGGANGAPRRLAGGNKVDFEWGRVSGPTSTVMSYHHDRYGVSGPTGVDGNFVQFVPFHLLGKPIALETFAPGAAPTLLMHSERFTFEPAFLSSVPMYITDDSLSLPPRGDLLSTVEAYLSWMTERKAIRGSAQYVSTRGYEAFERPYGSANLGLIPGRIYRNPCAEPKTAKSTGQRSRSIEREFTASIYVEKGWCQVESETTSEIVSGSSARRSRLSRLFTSDKRDIDSETAFGALDSGALVSKFTYFPTGELLSREDPRGYVTRYEQYKRGTAQMELHPVATANAYTESASTRIQISRVVDDLGRITSETNGEDRSVGFAYNGQHKPISITPTRGAGLSFAYGNTQDTVTRGSRVETVKYDGFGRVIEYNNGVDSTTYRYDAGGRRVFVSYPGKTEGQEVKYDALDRPIELIEPDPASPTGAAKVSTLITYDDSANTISIKAPNGGVTKLTMEAFGDPSDAWVKKRELPGGAGTIDYTRNVFGQIENIKHTATDGAVVNRSMKYDANKGYYLIEETHPELGVVKYVRDNNGNMTSRTIGTPDKTTLYTYDGQNRLVSVTPPAGDSAPAITRTWWKTGKPKAVVAGSVSRSYTFDANDNLATETVQIDGVSRSLSYVYDSLDSLSQVSYPSGRVVELYPDLLGRATSATPFITSATYHPSGMLKQLNFGNGTVQNFDEQRRPMVNSNKIAKNGATLLHLGFGYDQNANMTSLTEPTSTAIHGYARNASYDLFDRIKSIGNETFDYEGIGDFKATKNSAGVLSSFTYDIGTRRLSSVSGAVSRSYVYDVYGNVSSDGRGFAYAYDAYSTLRSTSGTSANSQYVYDGHQHMAKQTTNGVTKHFFYGMGGRMFGEYPATGSTGVGVREFIHLSGKMVGQAVTP